MGRKGTVPIEGLKETFYVRTRLNEDHVIHLAELYEAGQKLPALKVTEDGEIIDGRHRLHALRMLDRKGADVEFVEETDRATLILMALKANMGGSLPPSRGDMSHSIKLLLEAGMSRAKITESVPFPPSLVRKYLSSVQAAITRDKTLRAVRDVTERGMTVAEAARQQGVNADSVRDVINGNRRKKASIAEVKAGLSNAYRGRSRVLANIFAKMIQQYEDGELPAAKLIEAFEHVDKLHKQAQSTIKDWYKRFEAKKRGRENGAAA